MGASHESHRPRHGVPDRDVLLAPRRVPAVASGATAPAVTVVRLPQGAVQPQAAVDEDGTVHLIYLTGDPMAADIRYARAKPTASGGLSLGEPVRVNTTDGSAVAVGTVRGPHLSLGRDGRVHVAWMGSGPARPKAPGKHAPMLYTRLADDGRRFEPERNVITKYVGLDGGGSVAADADGKVYVAWHAPIAKGGDEGSRHVFVARSIDDGATFAAEEPLAGERLGACGCCGMRVLATPGDGGGLVGLFRTATDKIHRDTRAFRTRDGATNPPGVTLDPMESATCVMSTYALASSPNGERVFAAWETDGRIRLGSYPRGSIAAGHAVRLPEAKDDIGQKHPSVAAGAGGNVLVAWAEGTGWQQGGAVAWQVFDAKLRPIRGTAGRGDGLRAWGLPAAVALKGGGYVVIY